MTINELMVRYVQEELAKGETTVAGVEKHYNESQAPADLGDYTKYFQYLDNCIAMVEPAKVNLSIEGFKKFMENQYSTVILEKERQVLVLTEKYEPQLDAIKNAKIEEAQSKNKKVIDAFERENSVYTTLEAKRRELEKHGSEIYEKCALYGIKSTDVIVSNETFTVEELMSLYDKYIEFMRHSNSRKNPIRRLRESSVGDSDMALAVIVAILIVACILPTVSIFAIVFYAYLGMKQFQAKDVMSKYALLIGLIYNVRPMELGFKSALDDGLLVKEEFDEEESDDPEVNAILDEWDAEMDAIDDQFGDPDEELKEHSLSLINYHDKYTKDLETSASKFYKRKDAFLKVLEDRKIELEAEFEDGKSKIKLLGDEIKLSPVFDTKFALGLHDGVIEEFVDIGLQNIVIRPNPDEKRHRQFLQCLMANAMCNVRPGYLTIHLYDPNGLSQDLIPFYHPSLDKQLLVETGDMRDLIKNLKAIANDNNKEFRSMTINEYNEESNKCGRTTKEYKLLIILSQPKDIEEDEALREFMAYSARLGVLIWLVSAGEFENCRVFNKPFENVQHPYDLDPVKFPHKVSENLVKALASLKSPALMWKDFAKVALPESTYWTNVTDEFVDFLPGFWNGDPTLYKGQTLGNVGDVHGIVVGGTGAGKSVFLNHLITNMSLMYSPRELELWLIDFKGTEFKFYVKSKAFPYMLPHIKACLCTSDPEYSGSLFTAIRGMAEQRYTMLKKEGFKNIFTYNKAMRQAGTPEKIVKRAVVIIDEFQVIFEKADQKTQDKIKGDITYISKVARAAGVHMILASQSMKGTVSDDILQQFTLRYALRCDQAVSQAILDTNNASNIKEANGFLYVRTSASTKENQKKYRTPFLPEPEQRELIKYMSDRAIAEKIPPNDVITYEEGDKHALEEIDWAYKSKAEETQELFRYGLFVLGMRMSYSTNRAPDNIAMQAGNNQHMIGVYQDMTDFVNVFRTLMRNIDNWTDCKTKPFINSQQSELHYLCELDKIVDERMQPWSTEKKHIDELLKVYTGLYEQRVANNDKDSPLYIFCLGWDKAEGFGINRNINQFQKWVNLLQMCGEYNVHFIFLCTSTGELTNAFFGAFQHRLCGAVDEKASLALLESTVASKATGEEKNGFMYIKDRNMFRRMKIYQSPPNSVRKIAAKELVL